MHKRWWGWDILYAQRLARHSVDCVDYLVDTGRAPAADVVEGVRFRKFDRSCEHSSRIVHVDVVPSHRSISENGDWLIGDQLAEKYRNDSLPFGGALARAKRI